MAKDWKSTGSQGRVYRQHDGYYEVGYWTRFGVRDIERVAGVIKLARPSERVFQKVEVVDGDTAYEQHRRRMDDDINYRRWYDRWH